MKIRFPIHYVMALLVLFIIACNEDEEMTVQEIETEEGPVVIESSDFEAVDWTSETHSKDIDPNFNEVFQDNTVKRLDFVISEENWSVMLADMTNLYGSFGTRSNGGFADEDPVFVPGSVFYNGIEWYKVGLRFKGNSSLSSPWSNGNLKLSFKLDFDEFEDDFPQIDNQRFFGFKKLSLKNNFDDQSMLREKVASDVFRTAGLVGPHTAFYTLYVDFGEGPQYFGLYTMVEEVDGTVLDTQFSDDDGNLYKPDGDAATFAKGTYNEDEYVKKNNEDEADFSDVQSLLSILHDDTRLTDPATWRTNLDIIFDTDIFLKYLAVNTVIQNWDTYGRMTHNYFLYHNPETDKLDWIPWDNNEALQNGKRGGSLALDFSDLSAEEWPLIGYLYQDNVYKAKYDSYVQEVITTAFSVNSVQSLYSTYSTLVEPYATTEIKGFTFLNNSADFQRAVKELNEHVVDRVSAANDYLN